MEHVKVLLEALPYIKYFYGSTIVIKYGGAVMQSPQITQKFIEDIVLMKFVGIKPVIVHGGGKKITELLKDLGIESKFVAGHRITGEKELEIVEMVLTGLINKQIVAEIEKHGVPAVGISGKDGKTIVATKKVMTLPGSKENIDIGFVGQVKEINPGLINTLLDVGYVVVVSPIGFGEDGYTYNINADIVAGKLASALKSKRLIFLTDVDGVMVNGELVPSLTLEDLEGLISSGVISGGMLPKLEAVMDALEGGVEKVHIINGMKEHSILLELFTDKGIGTEIVRGGK